MTSLEENHVCKSTRSPGWTEVRGAFGVCPSNLMYPVSRRELTPVARNNGFRPVVVASQGSSLNHSS
jgi:hypothetical protein